MSGISIKSTGFDRLGGQFARAAGALEGGAIRQDMVDVVRPTVEVMRAAIPRKTGRTADDLGIQETPTGLAIGCHSGAHGRAYVMRFIEFGTRRMPARPVLRTTWDSEQPRYLAALYERWRQRILVAFR